VALTVEDRFWSKVKKLDNSCWQWTDSLDAYGYGAFRINGRKGKTVKAHRFSYELLIGEFPEGLDTDHLCRNRWCVNPYHLEPVTNKENHQRGNHYNSGAIQRARTHCPQGHPFDEENTYHHYSGGRWHRSCKQCKRKACLRYYYKVRRN